jgi:hypothetical protein
VAERANRTRKLSNRNDFTRAPNAFHVARQLRVPQRQLETKGHGLGVNAVGPADHRRPPMFLSPVAYNCFQLVEELEDEVAGVAHLQRLRRVDHI